LLKDVHNGMYVHVCAMCMCTKAMLAHESEILGLYVDQCMDAHMQVEMLQAAVQATASDARQQLQQIEGAGGPGAGGQAAQQLSAALQVGRVKALPACAWAGSNMGFSTVQEWIHHGSALKWRIIQDCHCSNL
jgi:hypothetical protein